MIKKLINKISNNYSLNNDDSEKLIYNFYYESRLKNINDKINKIYRSQIHSSKKRKHIPPQYTLLELKNWINIQKNFNKIIVEWELSNYSKQLALSVDRIDVKKGYCFNNIQLITWKENIDNESKRKKNFGCKIFPNIIAMYSNDGKLIKTFNTKVEASKYIGLNSPHGITKAIRNNYKNSKSGGYYWKEFNKDEEILSKIIINIDNTIEQLSKDNKHIAFFKNARQAAKALKIDNSSISACINQKRKSAGGYLWKKII